MLSKILIAITSILLWLFWRARTALAFLDTDINTAGFTETDTIPQFPNDQGKPDGLTKQWAQRLANNTAHNKRRTEQQLFLNRDPFVYSSASVVTREYDTTRNYVNKFVAVRVNAFESVFVLPHKAIPRNIGDFDETSDNDTYINIVYLQLLTAFQSITGINPIAIDGTRTLQIEMRARNMADGGGFEIKCTLSSSTSTTVFLIGTIEELRSITGVSL